MTAIAIGEHGEMALPGQVRDRYGQCANLQVRIVETRGGILLVPLTDAPMSEELQRDPDQGVRKRDQKLLGAGASAGSPVRRRSGDDE